MIARVDDARIFFETGFMKRVQDKADLGVDETAQTPICRDRPFSLVVVREEMVLTDDAIQRLDPWVTFVAVPRMHFGSGISASGYISKNRLGTTSG